MAEEPEAPDEDAEDEDGEGAAKKKKPSLMKLGLFAGLPALVLIMGGGAAFMLLGGGEEAVEEAAAHGETGGRGGEAGHASAAAEVVFYELPEVLVNIRSDDGRPSFIKLKLTLEVDSEETAHAIEPAMPRVMDRFNGFLRELRVEDLSGSAGSYRLRLELLRRVNLAVAPAEVNAVLIEEMLIQ
jgi:flagellar FliL protein